MRVPRIYTRQPLSPEGEFRLEASAAQHLVTVLRLSAGDALVVFNGEGGEYPATIRAANRKSVTIQTGTYSDRSVESPLSVHLGVALSRGERMDWVMQKATELGVSAITPLFTERTEVRLNAARAEKKLAHWQQVVISACEQCGRTALPLVNAPTQVGQWTAAVEADCKLVLHHRAAAQTEDLVVTSVALLTGPEGGLTEQEIGCAENDGFVSLALGPRVLRTETAPVAALALVQARWGDLPTW